MMIAIIHDPLRTDRMEILLKELAQQNITEYRLIPAIKESKNPVRNISQAHKSCVRLAEELSLESITILEDDVRFVCPSAFHRFMELHRELPEDWDVFLSGAYDAKISSQVGQLAKVSRFSGLHCYMISRKYYSTFLKADERVNVDKWMSTPGYGSSNAYLAYPMLALQHDGYSDNVRRITNYNQLVEEKYPLWKCE